MNGKTAKLLRRAAAAGAGVPSLPATVYRPATFRQRPMDIEQVHGGYATGIFNWPLPVRIAQRDPRLANKKLKRALAAQPRDERGAVKAMVRAKVAERKAPK